jgi:hypothetical protein
MNLTFPRFVRKVIDTVIRLYVIVLEFIFSLDIPQIEHVIFENLSGVPYSYYNFSRLLYVNWNSCILYFT